MGRAEVAFDYMKVTIPAPGMEGGGRGIWRGGGRGHGERVRPYETRRS